MEGLEDEFISCKYQRVFRSIRISFLQRIFASRSILQDKCKMISMFHPLEVGFRSAVGRARLADDLLNPNEICGHGRLVPTRLWSLFRLNSLLPSLPRTLLTGWPLNIIYLYGYNDNRNYTFKTIYIHIQIQKYFTVKWSPGHQTWVISDLAFPE